MVGEPLRFGVEMGQSPKFSIVIPTRNRGYLVGDAIQSALSQEFDDFEVIVSNNSSEDDTEQVVNRLADPRLRYFRTASALGMPDSWEFAISQARGEWVLVLEDDNVASAYLLQEIAAAERDFNTEVVVWALYHYYTERAAASVFRNSYVSYPVSMGATVQSSRDALGRLFRLLPSENTPKMFNSACKATVIQKVRARLGRFFISPAPDFTACVAILGFIDSYVYLDRPLYLNAGGDTTPHASPKSFTRFVSDLDEGANAGYAPIKLALLSPPNIVPESICKMKALLPAELADFELDVERYVNDFGLKVFLHEARGFDLSLDKAAMTKYLAGLPGPLQSKLRSSLRAMKLREKVRSMIRASLFQFAWVTRMAARFTTRSFVYGKDQQFDDALGAMRHLDRTLIRPQASLASKNVQPLSAVS